MAVERLLPTDEGAELVALVREVARAELAPRAAAEEAAGRYPRDVFAALGGLGLLGMPYPEEVGGLGQPYEVYLQALEEVAAAWMSVAVGVSVHVMSCHPLATWGTPAQQQAHLPDLLGGGLLGGYALSEAQAGSDIAGMTSRAKRTDEGYELHGAKAWVTHGSRADAYTVFARVGDTPPGGITCFLVPGDAAGLGFGAPERKMGLSASVDRGPAPRRGRGRRRPADRRRGPGDADRALRAGLRPARDRGLRHRPGPGGAGPRRRLRAGAPQFGRAVAEFQGMQFLLADMAAAVDSARATYLLAARKRDAGMAFTRDAAVAKLVATDAAMRVTTDAVQVLGGYGYTADFPAERYMREAKVTQIFEGTNQIQRLVIGRQLLGSLSGSSRAPR